MTVALIVVVVLLLVGLVLVMALILDPRSTPVTPASSPVAEGPTVASALRDAARPSDQQVPFDQDAKGKET